MVCGSLQSGSSNLALLRSAAAGAPAGVEVVEFDGIRHLPAFDPDLEKQGEVASVAAWRRAIAAADGLMIACPEYGYGMPGSLKNAIDWVIGSGELAGKAVAITAAVPDPERGKLALAALTTTLGAVTAVVVGGRTIVKGPESSSAAQALMAELVGVIGRQQSMASGEPG